MHGGEAVLLEGRVASRVRSAAYGFTAGRVVAYATLPADLPEGTPVAVDVLGERVAGLVAADVLHDRRTSACGGNDAGREALYASGRPSGLMMLRRAFGIGMALVAASTPAALGASGQTPLAQAPQAGAAGAGTRAAQVAGRTPRAACTGPTRTWVDGGATNTSTFNPLPDPGSIVLHTIHWVGYYGACDASWPRVGDIFSTFPRRRRGGQPALRRRARHGALRPQRARRRRQLPISSENPVACYYTPSGGASQQDARALPPVARRRALRRRRIVRRPRAEPRRHVRGAGADDNQATQERDHLR